MHNEKPPQNESGEYREVVLDISRKYLNEDGQIDIEDLLDRGETDRVKEYLVGAIDGLFSKGDVGEDEASEVFSQLKVSDEDKARYRRSN